MRSVGKGTVRSTATGRRSCNHLYVLTFAEYSRWHCDIKPENIIVAKNQKELDKAHDLADGKNVELLLKLTDPGFAYFQQRDDGDPQQDRPTAFVNGGTHTFGTYTFLILARILLSRNSGARTISAE
jgi:serine/threonine protein kinase